VIFTEPEIAAVGLSEEQARARGMAVRGVDYDIGRVSGAALYADGYTGRARIVVDEARGVIVGMTLVGPGVGELIHAATIAIGGEVPVGQLWHAIPAYPTISELWLRLLRPWDSELRDPCPGSSPSIRTWSRGRPGSCSRVAWHNKAADVVVDFARVPPFAGESSS